MNDYKKTWKPLILWMIGFTAVMVALAPICSALQLEERMVLHLILLLMLWGLVLLMAVIRRGEYIYWFSGGLTYEQAKRVPSEERWAYCDRVYRLFRNAALIATAAIGLSAVLHLPLAVEIIAGIAAILVPVIVMMRIPDPKPR